MSKYRRTRQFALPLFNFI